MSPLYPDNLPPLEVVDQSCPQIPEMGDTPDWKIPGSNQRLHEAAQSKSNLRKKGKKLNIANYWLRHWCGLENIL